ncbi:hypothetical protein QFC22_003274 [Naganishia vaughanmartiniae]|uniref:Uncharacterized protein n=1 Tax=Naganishia vaughanmartiniae TaxID=1424756 RepID=A0ACC2X846_9TREE|nr:hypothetical protein QFC22_003274 [Naganishia vaughanmartiniae]
MEPRVLGPAVSPGQLFYQQLQKSSSGSDAEHGGLPSRQKGGSQSSQLFNTIQSAFSGYESGKWESAGTPQRYVTSLPSSSKPQQHFHPREPATDEELYWFGHTVVWSRGTVVYRTFTFDHERQTVQKALFAWFRAIPTSAGSSETNEHSQIQQPESTYNSTRTSKKPVKKLHPHTFGPWSSSHAASWSSSGSTKLGQNRLHDSGKANPLQRCLVVFLESIARVYYPNGEEKILPVPFLLDNVWPLCGGGLVLQRTANRHEPNMLGKGKLQINPSGRPTTETNLDHTMELMLDEMDNNVIAMDLGLQPVTDQARVFTVDHPTSEMMALSHSPSISGGHIDVHGRHRRAETPSVLFPVEPSVEVLFVSDAPEIPIYACLDNESRELVFYRWTRLTDPPLVSSFAAAPLITRQSVAKNKGLPTAGTQSAADPKSTKTHKRVSIAPETTERRRPRQSHSTMHDSPPRRRLSQKRERSNTLSATTNYTGQPQSGAAIVRAALHENGGVHDSKETNARLRAEGEVIRGVSRKADRRWSNQVAMGGERQKGTPMALHDISEADLRDTTMLMGLEKVERSHLTDLAGEQIHRWQLPSDIRNTSDIEIFLSDILSADSSHVNIHLKGHANKLYIFKLERQHDPSIYFQMSQSFSYPASFASPIICSRPTIQDVLIQDPISAELFIITSHGRKCAIRLPSLPLRHIVAEPIRVLRVTDSRLTVKITDTQTVCMDLDMNVRHAVTQQCLSALSLVLDADDFYVLKTSILAYHRRVGERHWSVSDLGQVLFSLLGVLDDVKAKPPLAEQDPWEAMLGNIADARDFYLANAISAEDVSNRSATATRMEAVCDERLPVVCTSYVMQALHAVAEEARLVANHQKAMASLVSIIVRVAAHHGLDAWLDYWMRIIPACATDTRQIRSDIRMPRYLTLPFDYLAFLGRILREGKPKVSRSAVLNSRPGSRPSLEYGNTEPQPYITLVASVFANLRRDPPPGRSKEEHALLEMIKNGGNRDWLLRLSWYISLPIWEAVRALRGHTKTTWPLALYRLIERLDVAAQLKMAQCRLPVDPWIQSTREREVPKTYDHIMKVDKQRLHTVTVTPTKDEAVPLSPLSLPNLRFAHDRRLQDVERLLQYTRPRTIKLDERPGMSDEERQQYQQSVVDMIGMRNLSQIIAYGILAFDVVEPSVTERFPVPPICNTVYLAPSSTPFEVKTIPPGGLSSPAFHSGVVAGLSIRDSKKIIDSSWIVFNKPEKPHAEHAGFLLGLGFRGHLRCLTPWDAYPYLEARHEQTSLGLLLGMAASYAGSQDRLLTTVLSSHVSALLPTGSVELNTSPIVQAGALMSLGLVHVASGSFRFAEASLNEIQRRLIPGVEPFAGYREIYSFSAACAFGLIMLGRGNQNTDFEFTATERLRECLSEAEDGKDEDENGIEEDGIDLNVTAPGATLALGFMYMRSNREDISSMIRPPAQPFLLDMMRPDLLLIRTIAICLIHFDAIEATYDWLNQQLPDYIIKAWDKRVELNYIEDNIELAYLNIVAGACFCLGLKYVGSMDQSAYQIVYHFFMYFINSNNAGNSYEAKIRRAALKQAINMISVALALIVAAHGDVSTYRRLRQYHGNENSSFGTKTAVHMATALIFTGAGRYSFGSSNLAIASLCIAFFPRWPRSYDENKSYLQAYRHLWSLAVEPHCLSTVDIDTLQTVYMPLGVTTLSGGEKATRVQISPTLVSNIDQVISLNQANPRYMFQPLEISDNVLHRQILLDSQALFVRRRTPFLDYFNDPKGNRSLSILTEAVNAIPTDQGSKLTGPMPLNSETRHLDTIVATYGNAPWVRGFVNRFCLTDVTREVDVESGRFLLSQASIGSVLDCMVADRIDLLPRYLDFLFNLNFWDKDFGISYATSTSWLRQCYDQNQPSTSTAVEYGKRFALGWAARCEEELNSYWRGTLRWTEMSCEQRHGLAFYLTVNSVPSPTALQVLKDKVTAIHSFHEEKRGTNTLPNYILTREVSREATRQLSKAIEVESLKLEHPAGRKRVLALAEWSEASRLSALRAWL